MMKRWFFLLLIATQAQAADPQYAVTDVPPVLLKGADAVMRVYERNIRMNSVRDLRIVTRYAVTILNESGAKHAAFYERYDKLHEIKSIKGALYDASGKQLRKLKNSEVKDESAISDYSIMEDSRSKSHDFYHRSYPYTVEYEWEERWLQTFYLPGWTPQYNIFLSVQESRLDVTVPADYQLRYRHFNYKGEPKETPGKGEKTFTWQIKNVPALKKEPLAAGFRYRTTMVYLAPTDFAYGSYSGKINNWQDLGKFIRDLNSGREQLPEKTKNEVHALVDNIKDEREKVRLLYRYMQERTRYVSIQLGVGGFQPFDATYVSTKGYGDCKALSNYMYALLKEAGIRSNYILVKAGDGNTDLVEDFAANQFDHVILCVPSANSKDTIWLECTNQTAPFGYLGEFTNNRPVLLIGEDGGTLVRTPDYKLEQNQQRRILKAVINEEGDLKGTSFTKLTGLQQDWYHGLVHSVSQERQLEILKERLSLPSYDITSFRYSEHPDERPVPAMDESLEITVTGYASISGKRLFITPNVLNRATYKLDEETERKAPINLSMAYRDVDTVEITVPDGYTAESVFNDVNLESPFGKYTATVKVEGNRIRYIRVREQKEGLFPAKEYPALESFFNAIHKADRGRVVLVKAE